MSDVRLNGQPAHLLPHRPPARLVLRHVESAFLPLFLHPLLDGRWLHPTLQRPELLRLPSSISVGMLVAEVKRVVQRLDNLVCMRHVEARAVRLRVPFNCPERLPPPSVVRLTYIQCKVKRFGDSVCMTNVQPCAVRLGIHLSCIDICTERHLYDGIAITHVSINRGSNATCERARDGGDADDGLLGRREGPLRGCSPNRHPKKPSECANIRINEVACYRTARALMGCRASISSS